MRYPTRQRHVKIVANLGLASWSREGIDALCSAGADVFRLNMSHLDHDTASSLQANVRAVERDRDKAIAIPVDQQEPKLRTGRMPVEGVELETNKKMCLDRREDEGSHVRTPLPQK